MLDNIPYLNHIAIVLVEPKFPENIGAAARAAFNMGISRLVVVRKEAPAHEPMAKMATHKAAHLIENLSLHDNLEEALEPFSFIIGTTARRGRQRRVGKTPRDCVKEILPLLPDNQVAILFGPENCGLSNSDLRFCHLTSCIPTADFSSLNLAQAVAIHCYEIYYGLIHEQKDINPGPQLASSFELEGMYSHLEEALLRIDFLQEKSHTYWMNNIRKFLARVQLTSKESNLIRGVCRQFLWHQSTVTEKKDKE